VLESQASGVGNLTFQIPATGPLERRVRRRHVRSWIGWVASALELGRKREHAFCCGAGGGRMWMDEKARSQVTTTAPDENKKKKKKKNILATGATTWPPPCPYCTVMIKDAVDDRDAGERVQVKNLSELVAKAMVRSSAPNETAAQ